MGASDPAWLATLLEAPQAALVGVDLDGRVVFWSAGAEALFGWSEREVLGEQPPIVPASLRPEWQLQMQAVFDRRLPTPAAETDRVARDGRVIAVVRTAWPVRGEDGAIGGMLDLLVDATALKQLDEESRTLMRARERERVGMDLHDGLIQSLYAVVLNLASQEHTLRDQPAALAAVKAARVEIERMIAETRAYVLELRSRAFAPPNLEAGLRLLVDGLRFNSDLDVQLRVDASAARLLEAEARGHVLYLAREAMSNVVRHAGATRVRIALEHAPEAVVLSVEDNGQGFVTASPARDGQRGMRNMRERARLVGGRLHVDSQPAGGTRVRLEIPL